MNNGYITPVKITLLLCFAIHCIFPAYASDAHSGNNSYANMSMLAQAQAAATDSIIAPNIFTPNGDKKNDLFEVTSSDGRQVSLKIFSRAGVLIYSIKATICQWDGYSLSGQQMANGVYYYVAEVPGSSPKISKSGFVHLFR